MIYGLYNGKSDVLLPNGVKLTSEEFKKQYPIANTKYCVIGYEDLDETDVDLILSVDSLIVLRANKNIDPKLSNEEALAEWVRLVEEEKTQRQEKVDVQEAILAQLEYQSMMME